VFSPSHTTPGVLCAAALRGGKQQQQPQAQIMTEINGAAVFLDIEKAFDTTWHHGLLYKLSKLKYSANVIKLLGSFLSQRKFRVPVEGEMSTPREMQAGVPQVSVLSPTLFMLYINPFPSGVKIYPTLLPYQSVSDVEFISHVFVSRFSVYISIILPSLAVYNIPTNS
jgi:hypothetical protein